MSSKFGGKVESKSEAGASKSSDALGSKPTQLAVEIKVEHGFGIYANETKYGPTGHIRDNIGFLAESKVIHPIGKKACSYQLDKHKMDFFDLNPNVEAILGMAVAPNRKRVAFCEKARLAEGKSPHGQVSVYHVVQGSHLRTLTFPNMKGQFISCCFTKDTKFLVALGSAPENYIVYWKWSNLKLIAHTKAPVTASRIRVNPADASMITTSGPQHLKLWRLEKDLSLRSSALLPGKTESKTHFVDHAWMRSKGVLLALTNEGNCYVFEINDTSSEIVQSLKVQTSPEAAHRFETIETYKKGFVVAGTGTDLGGYMCVYEHTDDRKEPFMLIKYFYTEQEHLTITNLAISPLDEKVVMFTQPDNQLITFPLVNIDTLEAEQGAFTPMRNHGYHTGRVLDIDICQNKPHVVTCGADKCIKVWAFESSRSVNEKSIWECQVSHYNETDEPYCVAFHPSGLQVLVGYKDNIQYFNVLNDCLEPVRPNPLNVKNCKALRFSPGGHLFAASFGISIEIYNTYTFELVKTLMGHIRRVRSLSWYDNSFIYSTGEDGSVYGWNVETGKRVDETTIQMCAFSGIASDRERPIVCAAGNDKKLYEVRRNEQGETEYATCNILGEDLITEVVITNQNNAVIAGTATGCLRVYPWPLGKHADPTNYQEIKVHNGQINNLVVTNDDFYVLSCGDDGTIFATAIESAASMRSKTQGADPVHFNYNAVLVDNEKVYMKDKIIAGLRKEIEEMKSRNELEMAMQSKVWHDQLKQKTEEMDAAIAVERDRFETLNQRHEAYSREHMEEVDKRETNHIVSMQAIENEYEHRLAVEIARYDEVSEAMELQQQEVREEIEALRNSHMERLEKLEEQRVKEVNAGLQQIELLNDELKKNELEYNTILAQQTEDDDQEILELQKKREKDEEAYHDMVSKMTAMLHQQTDRCEKLQAKMEEVQEVAKVREQEYASLKKAYYDLQDMLKLQERQLDEREVSLQQKERTILGLRSKHSTLENFKYVLNHRIQMLSKEKGPVAEHIDALEKHIRDMYEELVNEFHDKKLTTRALGDSKMKMTGLQNDIKGLTSTLRDREREIMAFTHQLTTIINYVDPKEYESSMNDLYRTFVKKEKGKGRRTAKPSQPSEKKDGEGDANSATASSGKKSGGGRLVGRSTSRGHGGK